METNKETEDTNEEDSHEWQKTHRLGAYDNMMPIIRSMILMVENEKQRTIDKLEEAKKLLQQMKETQRK